MKIYNNTSKRWLAGISAACLLSLLLSSCLKDNKNSYYTAPVAYLSFIQASPDEPALDFYLNNNKVNVYNPLVYGNLLDYFQAYVGTRTVNLYNQGSTTKILSDTIHLSQGNAYSLFLTNVAAHPDLVLLTDTISQPPAGYATVRFVNVSPDAPMTDLAIQGGSVLIANKAYKGASPFVQLSGNKTYNFEVRQSGTSTVLATMTNIKINAGQVYTIWLHGLANTSTTAYKLNADILTNAYYY